MLSNLINPQTEVSIRISWDYESIGVLIVLATRRTTVIKAKVQGFNPEYFCSIVICEYLLTTIAMQCIGLIWVGFRDAYASKNDIIDV